MDKDSKDYYRACDVCQRMGRPLRRDEFPLTPLVSFQAFDKWEIDFVGPIQPLGNKTSAIYIIRTIEY